MRLNNKGKSSVGGGTIALITAVIAVVILFASAPELYSVLSDALVNISAANIPLVSGMTGIIGLIFGAVVLLGGLFYLMQQMRTK